ncbi:MAG: rod shape-determining protein MreD, partial [Chloroflexota bacterium]
VRVALAIVVPVAAALLQGTLGPLMDLGGVRPNMPILVAASWSVAAGAGEGLWWAFVGGLAADLLSGGPLGAFTVSSLPGALAVGLGERSLARPVPVVAGAAAVGLAALVAALLYTGVLALVGHPLAAPAVLGLQTVGSALYTAGLALAVYPLARIGRRLTETESPF